MNYNMQGSMTTSASGSMLRRLSFTPPGDGSKGKGCAGTYDNMNASPMKGTMKRSSPLDRVKSGVVIGRTNVPRKSNVLMVPKV
jgi:hypothetical protein